MPTRKPPPPKRKPAPPPPAPKLPARPRGNQPYVPTDKDRSRVAAMVLADNDQALIARVIGISPTTLRKAYRAELDTTYAIIKSDIVAKVVTMARAGDFKAAQFYLECHGWVRSERIVVADGGIDDSDLSALSDEQLNARLAQLERRRDRKRS